MPRPCSTGAWTTAARTRRASGRCAGLRTSLAPSRTTRCGGNICARRDLVSGLADEIRGAVKTWTRSAAPAWARPLLATNQKLTAEIAVFRAAVGVDDADSRLTGAPQYPVRARKIQRLLEEGAQQIIGRESFGIRRWHAVVDEIDPRIRRDQYWTALAARLTEIACTGVDVRQLVADAAAQGPLPDELPAAALWWRIFGTVSPATLESGSQRLRPAWLADLHAVFGTTLAETIAADPAFPGLVAAVGAADPARWTARDLLHVEGTGQRDSCLAHVDHNFAILRPWALPMHEANTQSQAISALGKPVLLYPRTRSPDLIPRFEYSRTA
jgi:hypothetical protein